MREADQPSKRSSADSAQPARSARKGPVRVNDLPDTYPTDEGSALPSPSVTLIPVAAPISPPPPIPAPKLAPPPVPVSRSSPPAVAPPPAPAAEPDLAPLVFEALAAPPRRVTPKPR